MSRFTRPLAAPLPRPRANERAVFFREYKFWFYSNLGGLIPPTICSCYGANYGRMSRQFPDNRQCCRETIVPTPALSFSFLFFYYFCWWRYISLCLKYGSILGAGAHYSLPRSCRDSIPSSVCWAWQKRPAHPHWTLSFFLFQSYVSGSVPLSMLKILEKISVTRKKEKKHTQSYQIKCILLGL